MRLALPEWYRELVEPGLDGAEVAFYRDEKDALEALPQADGLWLELWGHDPSVEALINAGERLRWVQLSSAGVESMDLDLLQRRRILLTNAAGLHAPPIAEHVVMCMLMARRGMLPLLRAQAEGRWDRRAAGRAELDGATVLVLGYGQIGRAVGRKAAALGARVTGARRRGRAGKAVIVGDAWRRLLPESDFLVVAAPHTAATRGMVGKAELDALKPGAWLINIARGPLVQEAALLEALDGDRLGGAALDVFDEEPLPPGHPLWSQPNVILTPHVSAGTDRMRERAAALYLDNVARFRSGRRLRNVVDLRAGY